MISRARQYLLILLLLMAFDGFWLWSMFPVYQSELGPIMARSIRLIPALLFYLIYAASILFFAICPSHSVAQAIQRGAVLGVTAYGTYDLTNRATLELFPLFLTCIDLAWGSLLTALVSGIGKKWLPLAGAPQG